MPSSIVLSDISWATPDGRSLFSHLDLTFGAERTGLVGRNGAGKTTLVRLIEGARAPTIGRVTIHGTLGVLRQRLQPGPGEIVADLFGARAALDLLHRAETGAATGDELAEVDWSLAGRIAAALTRLHLDVAPSTPLATLSGGQQTRAGLAALVFLEPDVLILDEPTNNLDRDGRDAVIELLAGWRAGAVVVSHDRELLGLMDAIVEISTLGVRRYGGNWEDYRAQRAVELASARHDVLAAEKQVSAVARDAQIAAERQARRDNGGRRKRARGDTPRIELGRLKDRAEDSGGSGRRLAERLRADAREGLLAARKRIEVLQPFSVPFAPTRLPSTWRVLAFDTVTAGYEAGPPVIRDLTFHLVGPQRVAVTGRNGSGKTTLLKLATGALEPRLGKVRRTEDFAMLDQDLGLLDRSSSIRDNFHRLNPGCDENSCRAALARFRFRADAALTPVATLSGGETLRAGLACVLGGPKPPMLLILDEPTNHLDIDSIETIEAGLQAYDGALLVVSHDAAFLEAIGITRRLDLDKSLE